MVTGPELTSPRAARVKAAQRLAKRAFRARDRRFLAEGPQAVREAVARPGTVLEVFATRDAATRHAEIVAAAESAGAPVVLVSGEVMSALSQTVTPQGLVAVCRLLDQPLADVLAGGPRLVAVLAHARDPGNVGTVVRAADAAGADAVLVTGDSVDPYNGKSVRASAGSLFHLPVSIGDRVEADLPALRAAGLRVLAADGPPTSTSTRQPTPGCSTARRPGCSATRPGACRSRPGRSPTRSSRCRSTAGPSP